MACQHALSVPVLLPEPQVPLLEKDHSISRLRMSVKGSKDMTEPYVLQKEQRRLSHQHRLETVRLD